MQTHSNNISKLWPTIVGMISVIFLLSCAKEQVNDYADLNASVGHEKSASPTRHYWDNGDDGINAEGLTYGCKAPGQDCFYTVTIRPKERSGIREVISVIQQGNAQSTIEAFEANSQALLEYIDQVTFQRVMNGELNVSVPRETAHAAYMVFKDSNNNVVVVYPMELGVN